MQHVQIDAARLIILLPDHDDLFCGLDEIDGLHAMEQKSGNTDRPAGGLARVTGFSGEDSLVALAQLFSRPGLKDRVGQIGNRKGRLAALDSSARWIVRKKID